MKIYKKIIIGLFATVLVAATTISCSGFLDENLDTQRSTDYFETPEGIEALATGIYYNLRFHFAYEWSFATTNYGTDEFRVGGDGSNAMWNSYDGSFSSLITAVNVNTAMAETLWDNMYTGINSANILIHNASSESYIDANKSTYLGEGYFLRGFNYLKLVRQYGGVPIKLTPSTTLEREFTRSTAQETLAQVIDDLTQAYNLLPATAATGKLTKYVAAHFLAKAYLTRASEINDSWNGTTKRSDCEQVLRYADEVITRHQLASNFSDLWNYTTPDGPNEMLDEIILAAQFTSNASTWGTYGNQVHLYYLSQYLNLPQMKRDIAGGREYQRLRTTYFMYNVFNMTEDSRFWKSFKTKYAVNNPTSTNYELGDLSIMYIINRPGDMRFTASQMSEEVVYEKTGKKIPTVFPAYVAGRNDNAMYDFLNRFPPLNKYLDGSRQAVGDGIGYRDGILARVADTYLLAAEAKIRLDDYSGALTYINQVRARAAYKNGEDRSAYTDGGAAYHEGALGYASMGIANSFFAENSYYESNNIMVTTAPTSLIISSKDELPAEDEAIIATLGYTGDYSRMMCFLLNERSRELCGEFHRWEDLARTKTLAARSKAYNPDAANNISDHHCLRPIPQKYLDSIQKDGKALTAEEKKEQQNPGY